MLGVAGTDGARDDGAREETGSCVAEQTTRERQTHSTAGRRGGVARRAHRDGERRDVHNAVGGLVRVPPLHVTRRFRLPPRAARARVGARWRASRLMCLLEHRQKLALHLSVRRCGAQQRGEEWWRTTRPSGDVAARHIFVVRTYDTCDAGRHTPTADRRIDAVNTALRARWGGGTISSTRTRSTRRRR